MHSKPDTAAFGPQRSDLMFSVAKLMSFPLLRVQSLDATATPHALPAYVICTTNNFQGESFSINCQEMFHTEPFLCILIGTLTSHPQFPLSYLIISIFGLFDTTKEEKKWPRDDFHCFWVNNRQKIGTQQKRFLRPEVHLLRKIASKYHILMKHVHNCALVHIVIQEPWSGSVSFKKKCLGCCCYCRCFVCF